MKAITPEQSEHIHAEITAQLFALDDLMSRFRAPWGEVSRRRIRGIIQKRMAAVFAPNARERHNENYSTIG